MPRLILFIALTFLTLPVQAFRCGSGLITRGDHLTKVLKQCGEPVFREHWVESGYAAAHPLLPHYRSVHRIVVREWTYNFGPHKFMRQLRFENGLVTKIKTLDYGY